MAFSMITNLRMDLRFKLYCQGVCGRGDNSSDLHPHTSGCVPTKVEYCSVSCLLIHLIRSSLHNVSKENFIL